MLSWLNGILWVLVRNKLGLHINGMWKIEARGQNMKKFISLGEGGGIQSSFLLGSLSFDKLYCSSLGSVSSVSQSCPTVCDPMNRSTSGLPVHHKLPEFTQTHVHWVCDIIQPSHPLSSPSPPAPNPSQHQSLFQWVNSLHEGAKVLEFQL